MHKCRSISFAAHNMFRLSKLAFHRSPASAAPVHQLHMYILCHFIAPKASAEGACILAEMCYCYCYCNCYCYCYCYCCEQSLGACVLVSKTGYCYRVWLVTEIVVCVVTVMLWYMGHTYRSQIWVQTGHAFWRLLL